MTIKKFLARCILNVLIVITVPLWGPVWLILWAVIESE